MIRNECVNDGRPESGNEVRNADLLQTYLEGAGLDVERFESRPGRTSIVARIEGSEPDAPALCLMGHTDVVPVNADGWSRDPFGGELVDGEVWGRGAIDMLNITSSMAVAFRQLATEGFRPRGTLIYFGVADEEAGGQWGAEYMVDNHWDAVGAEYVLTESGGWSQMRADGTRSITVNVAEKGLAWRRLRVAGTPGHGSMPYGADNALDHRGRGRPPARRLPDDAEPRRSVVGPPGLDRPSRRPAGRAVRPGVRCTRRSPSLPPLHGRVAHACSHTTISPNVIHGGQKTNTIPDVIDIDVDVRTVPGDTKDVVDRYLAEALGELADRVEITTLMEGDATRSPIDNPLWEAVTACTHAVYPEARVVPGLITGGTDARFFRLKGSVAYGAALFSEGVTLEEFGSRFHGNDERVDTRSLGLSTDFWYRIAKQARRLTLPDVLSLRGAESGDARPSAAARASRTGRSSTPSNISSACRRRSRRTRISPSGPGSIGFDPEELARLLTDREVVRIVVMRGTIHLVTAADALVLRPLMQPVLDAELARHRDFGPALRGVDMATVLDVGRAVLDEQPRTGAELRRALAEHFPDLDAAALAYACRCLLRARPGAPAGCGGGAAR